MNKIILIGNIVRDPELKTFGNDKQVATVNLAVSRRFKNAAGERESDFFHVSVWGKLADIVMEHTAKGSKIAVEGEMNREEWETKEGKKSSWKVTASNIELLGTPPNKTQQQKVSEPPFKKFAREEESYGF